MTVSVRHPYEATRVACATRARARLEHATHRWKAMVKRFFRIFFFRSPFFTDLAAAFALVFGSAALAAGLAGGAMVVSVTPRYATPRG